MKKLTVLQNLRQKMHVSNDFCFCIVDFALNNNSCEHTCTPYNKQHKIFALRLCFHGLKNQFLIIFSNKILISYQTCISAFLSTRKLLRKVLQKNASLICTDLQNYFENDHEVVRTTMRKIL